MTTEFKKKQLAIRLKNAKARAAVALDKMVASVVRRQGAAAGEAFRRWVLGLSEKDLGKLIVKLRVARQKVGGSTGSTGSTRPTSGQSQRDAEFEAFLSGHGIDDAIASLK